MNLDGKFLRLEAERETKNGGKAVLRTTTSPLEAARREAAKVRSALLDGRDPLAERRKADAAATNTVAAIAAAYMADEGRSSQREPARTNPSGLHSSKS